MCVRENRSVSVLLSHTCTAVVHFMFWCISHSRLVPHIAETGTYIHDWVTYVGAWWLTSAVPKLLATRAVPNVSSIHPEPRG